MNPASVSLYPRRREVSSAVDVFVSSGALQLPRATVSGGAFSIAGIAPGEYTLVARSGSGQRGAPVATSIIWSVTDITVDGVDQADLPLHLQPGATLSGTIVLERSTDAPTADLKTLQLSLAASGSSLGSVSTPRAVVDPGGGFRFSSLAPALYTLRASLPPEAAKRWTLKSALLKGRDISDGRFEARPGGDLDGVVITLTDRPTEVSGRLLDAAGADDDAVFGDRLQRRSIALAAGLAARAVDAAIDGWVVQHRRPAARRLCARARPNSSTMPILRIRHSCRGCSNRPIALPWPKGSVNDRIFASASER